MTIFIWLAFGLFFQKRATSKIQQICPIGKQNLVGGKVKRNIQTLQEDFYMLLIYCLFSSIDNILLTAFQVFQGYLGKLS